MNFSSPLAQNTNWSNNSPNLSNIFNNSVTTGFGNFGAASLPVMGLQQQVLGQQQQQIRNPVNSKPDLSAFDSLLSPVSSQSKPSMNNMRGSGGVPMLQPQQQTQSMTNNNKNTNQLSMNDINDFLS